MTLTATTLTDLPAIAQQIIAYAGSNRIFIFYGDMGAGKTTLIKELCACLGVTENVSSPTFSIVNEYAAPGSKVYHFDFYRLKSQTEAFDMGYEEYFYSGDYCFVEWPEKIPDLLPVDCTKVSIDLENNGSRKIIVQNI